MQPPPPPSPCPPPPPPPPPPPAPGLPPFHGGPGLLNIGGRRRSTMRNFNWETLPKNSVIGKHNIWTEDGTVEEYKLDTEHMEELFSNKQKELKAMKQQSLRSLPAAIPRVDMVTILNSKRSMNIGIFLKQFKRSLEDMIESIRSGSDSTFGPGKLQELSKLQPDEGEVKQLLGFKGHHTALPEADLFMLMLIQIPCYKERLSSMVLKEELFPLLEEMRGSIRTLKMAGRELLDSDHLHSVIRLVLKTGNYINAGGYAGSALGFRMSSLLKLADTKANKPGMNLMHYVVMQAQNADTTLLKFAENLEHVKDAARLNQGDLETQFKKQVDKVNQAKADALKEENLKMQMETFLEEAEVCLAEVETDLKELQSVSDHVAGYFCEDPKKFNLEECCSIFKSFCDKFSQAMQENKAREVAEVKRRQRDRLQIAAKRRSTATCSSRDKELDGGALESFLQKSLAKRNSRTRSGRPLSTHVNSSSSSSPNLGSLSEIISQTNRPSVPPTAHDLGKKEWNSAVELTDNSKTEDGEESVTTGSEEDLQTSKEDQSGGFTDPIQSVTCTSSNQEDVLDNTQEDVQEDVRDNTQEDVRDNTQEDVRDNTQEDVRDNTQEDVRDNTREDVRDNTREDVRDNTREDVRDKSQEDVQDNTQEDVQDNTQEEAQRLREVSKRVLQFQRSRGSASSGEYSTETIKSPPPSSTLSRHLTFDEAMQRKDEEDLSRSLLDPQSSSKSKISRRHTLPPMVPEDEDFNIWTETSDNSSKSAGQENVSFSGDVSGRLMDSTENTPSDPSSALSGIKSKATLSSAESDNRVFQEGPTPRGSADRNMRFKKESSGVFFNFFKRLSDIGKIQNSKERVQKGNV